MRPRLYRPRRRGTSCGGRPRRRGKVSSSSTSRTLALAEILVVSSIEDAQFGDGLVGLRRGALQGDRARHENEAGLHALSFARTPSMYTRVAALTLIVLVAPPGFVTTASVPGRT